MQSSMVLQFANVFLLAKFIRFYITLRSCILHMELANLIILYSIGTGSFKNIHALTHLIKSGTSKGQLCPKRSIASTVGLMCEQVKCQVCHCIIRIKEIVSLKKILTATARITYVNMKVI